MTVSVAGAVADTGTAAVDAMVARRLFYPGLYRIAVYPKTFEVNGEYTTGLDFTMQLIYCKVASRSMSRLVTCPGY